MFYVADPISSIETRLLPTLTRSYPCHFTFYVARPTRSIETRLLPTLTRSYPRHFTFYVARPTRSIRSEGLLRFFVPRKIGRAPAGSSTRSQALRRSCIVSRLRSIRRRYTCHYSVSRVHVLRARQSSKPPLRRSSIISRSAGVRLRRSDRRARETGKSLLSFANEPDSALFGTSEKGAAAVFGAP